MVPDAKLSSDQSRALGNEFSRQNSVSKLSSILGWLALVFSAAFVALNTVESLCFDVTAFNAETSLESLKSVPDQNGCQSLVARDSNAQFGHAF